MLISIQHLCASVHDRFLSIVIVSAIVFAFTTEQRHHVLHSEILDSLAALDGRIGEFALRFLQFENALFDRVVDAETVDCYVDGLIEAVNTINCLFFNEL